MLKIINIQEMVTRNARKMKYYNITLDDGTVKQLTKSMQGKYYLDGQEVVDPEDIKDLENFFILQQRAKFRR